MLKKTYINTPLGDMLAIANDSQLYMLEFLTRKHLDTRIERLLRQNKIQHLALGNNPPLQSITHELGLYFENKLKVFTTPFKTYGTPFQNKAWQALCQIPYGTTQSYATQAKALGMPKAHRAVANANANNSLAILIPCHRVIRANQTLGGYAAGLRHKTWLIAHEERSKNP